MKRTLLTAIVGIVILISGCNQNTHMTAWGMAQSNLDSPDNEYTGRFGLCNGEKAGDVEGGLEVNYSGVHDRPNSYGMYGIYHLGGDPGSFIGAPYIGYRLGTNGGEGGYYSPMIGTIYWDIFGIEARVAQEYTGKLSEKYKDEYDEHVVAGFLRYEFRF